MSQLTASLHLREWRLFALGWGTYMGLLVVYCLAHQAYVKLAPVDIVDSLVWTLREWGIWLLLTPAISMAMHRRRTLAPNALTFYGLLSACVLTISLGYRVGLDLLLTGEQFINSLVYFFPQYAQALAIVIAGWHFLQRTQRLTQLPNDRPAPSAIDRLLVSKGQHETLIAISEILAISAAGNYVDIHTARGTYLLRSTLKQLGERLPKEEFLRTHRSHIVRLSEIDRIEILPAGNGWVYLNSGLSVALSKGYRKALKNQETSSYIQSPHHSSIHH